GAVAADDRRGWTRRLLPRSAGSVDRELLAIGRRSVYAGRFCRAHLDVGRAGVDQLPGLRYLGAAAQWTGYRGSPDAQPARALRSEAPGVRFCRNAAPDDRGQETGVRGPGALLRRHGESPGACQGADLEDLRGSAAGADRSGASEPAPYSGRTPSG